MAMCQEGGDRLVSADEVQGRLALLGICSALGPGNSDGHSAPSGLTFHQHMRAEVDGILKDSLNRRLKKVEGTVNRLLKGGGSPTANGRGSPKATNGCSSPTSGAVPKSEQSAQTTKSGQVAGHHAGRLAEATEKAIQRAMICARPPQKKFVEKKCRQNAFAEPAEKEEPIKKESYVMKSTLEALKQNTCSRERQINNLKSQIVTCKEHVTVEEQKCSRADETLSSLKENRANMPQMHKDWASQRSAEKDHLRSEVSRMKKEAKRYEVLAKSQHAFFMQTEAIFQRTGQEKIQRSPAGDLMLMPQPLPMDDEEKVEDWDVGTAIANPYCVDSWPFEANVLARRCNMEATMDEVREETFEDLVEARRPVSRAPPIMNFRGGNSDDDEEDDDEAGGPSATSRSL